MQMYARPIIAAVAASVSTCAGPAFAQDVPAKQRATAHWMIEQARARADQACGGKWVISDLLADDFTGTSPKGTRYAKPTGRPPNDPTTQWSKDCSLDEADVRFFGSDVALMYGVESKTVALAGGTQERHCLVWTDTWLRRKGKWQIIAVQDNRIECAASPRIWKQDQHRNKYAAIRSLARSHCRASRPGVGAYTPCIQRTSLACTGSLCVRVSNVL
jgi:Domain of unknown function (DUF4440)